MNGIEKIVARLEADSKAEIDALNAETAAQCEAIRQEYSDKAKALFEEKIKAGTAACAAQEERLAGAADMEARKQLLAFKQQLVSKAFEEAERRLADLPREEYIAFLASLAAKAATYGTEELVFNARDAKEVGSAVAKAANAALGAKGHLTVSEETRQISGGLIVKQGDIETNCALDMLVAMQRSALASQVAEVLFT